MRAENCKQTGSKLSNKPKHQLHPTQERCYGNPGAPLQPRSHLLSTSNTRNVSPRKGSYLHSEMKTRAGKQTHSRLSTTCSLQTCPSVPRSGSAVLIERMKSTRELIPPSPMLRKEPPPAPQPPRISSHPGLRSNPTWEQPFLQHLSQQTLTCQTQVTAKHLP